MERWPQMRAALHDYGMCAGMEKRALKKTEIAIEEAVVNIVNYSQAEWMEIEVKGERLKDAALQDGTSAYSLEITLRDNGIAFDPTQQAEVDIERATAERQIGGLGIALLRQIMDEINYERSEEKNILTLVKKINA
jgi:anti-sigma regulatory factor (Ser/Thr protein kinase)